MGNMRFSFNGISYIIEDMERILVVSEMQPQRKKKDRYNIYIDGDYAASLSAETCVVYGIKTGSGIREETLQEAVMRDNTRYAFDTAANLLSHKMRTRKELTDRLTERGIDPDAIEAAMDKLEGYGYVDDVGYAREFVDSAIHARKYGRKVVQHKLKQKGIDDDIIEQAMQTFTCEIEKDIAKAYLSALRRQYSSEPADKKRKKTFAALQRRGFDYDIINILLSEEEN